MTTQTESTPALRVFTDAFDALLSRDGVEAAAIRALRKRAFALFRNAGFPTTRQEEWRFTNVAPIARGTYTVDTAPTAAPGDALRAGIAGERACSVTVLDGRWSAGHSSIQGLPPGVEVRPLREGEAQAPAEVLSHVGSVTDIEGNAFAALNTALFRDAVVVVVADGIVVERPIEILFTVSPGEPARAVFPRLLVVAGKNSQFSIVETFGGNGTASGVTNAVAEFIIGEGARVEHDRLQNEPSQHFHINTLSVRQEQGSVFTSNALTFGGALVRNGIHVTLAGSGAECTLNGLAIGTGAQHIDNHTTIDHAAASCTSHELYKTILGATAHGVFNGKIFVRPGAQKTDAKQTNKTILLSNDAVMNTKPQLEIFADDVKCTHGATVGQLDDEQVFYLRARGIGEAEARAILTLAFANDVVSRVHDDAVREQLDHLLRDRLEGGRTEERR